MWFFDENIRVRFYPMLFIHIVVNVSAISIDLVRSAGFDWMGLFDTYKYILYIYRILAMDKSKTYSGKSDVVS